MGSRKTEDSMWSIGTPGIVSIMFYKIYNKIKILYSFQIVHMKHIYNPCVHRSILFVLDLLGSLSVLDTYLILAFQN